MKRPPRLPAAEWAVMKVIWRRGACTAQQIIDELAGSTDWTAPTIKTLLNRLLHKGALNHARSGKSYIYSAAWSQAECREVEAHSFLDRVFDGAVSPMLAHFVRTRQLKPEDLRELRRILEEGA